jgi:hypothetical protein
MSIEASHDYELPATFSYIRIHRVALVSVRSVRLLRAFFSSIFQTCSKGIWGTLDVWLLPATCPKVLFGSTWFSTASGVSRPSLLHTTERWQPQLTPLLAAFLSRRASPPAPPTHPPPIKLSATPTEYFASVGLRRKVRLPRRPFPRRWFTNSG